MELHDVGGHVPIGFLGVGADGGQGRQCLETELAHKARVLVAVSGERFAPMPYVPIMGIALLLAVRISKGVSEEGELGQ